MRLLLDTHIFLWFISGDPRLPLAFREAIRDEANEVYLSVASGWETVIKHSLGKLILPDAPDVYFPRQRERHGIASLAIDEGVLTSLAKLPPLHRDPFDRMLVAQALLHDLTLVTVDDALTPYPVALLPTA